MGEAGGGELRARGGGRAVSAKGPRNGVGGRAHNLDHEPVVGVGVGHEELDRREDGRQVERRLPRALGRHVEDVEADAAGRVNVRVVDGSGELRRAKGRVRWRRRWRRRAVPRWRERTNNSRPGRESGGRWWCGGGACTRGGSKGYRSGTASSRWKLPRAYGVSSAPWITVREAGRCESPRQFAGGEGAAGRSHRPQSQRSRPPWPRR